MHIDRSLIIYLMMNDHFCGNGVGVGGGGGTNDDDDDLCFFEFP